MSQIPEPAGYWHAGRFCRACEGEIVAGDEVFVDPDGDYDDEGRARDLTTVQHVTCPPEDE